MPLFRSAAARIALLGLLACAMPHQAALAQEAPPAFDAAEALKNPADYISLSKELPAVKRVVIPTFRVIFGIKAKGSASASALGASGTANVHGSYTLTGVDDAQMQAITEAVYKHFTDTLKAQGVEVIGFDQIPAELQAALKEKALPQPLRFSFNKREYAAFTPAGLPFYAGMYDTGAYEAYGFGGKLSHIGWSSVEYVDSRIAGQMEATLLRPVFWVEFINIETSGNMFSGRASVNAEPGLKLVREYTFMHTMPHSLLQTQPKPGGGETLWVPADWNFAGLPVLGLNKSIQPADSGLVAVNNTTDAAVAAIQTAVNILGVFTGGAARKDLTYDVVMDPARYAASSQQALGAVAEMWAKRLAGK